MLIAWAAADEVPELEGDVAGIGGSTAVEIGFREIRYVTGQIVLDSRRSSDLGSRPSFGTGDRGPRVRSPRGSTTSPTSELMYSDNVGRTTYGPGDLKGLAMLGNLPCQ